MVIKKKDNAPFGVEAETISTEFVVNLDLALVQEGNLAAAVGQLHGRGVRVVPGEGGGASVEGLDGGGRSKSRGE